MKKTYITTMPDKSGAFLEAGRAIRAAGANITRVSYNRAVDIHTLFLDVSGTQRQLERVTASLKDIGYILGGDSAARVLLVEFVLRDVPGAVVPVLELIHRHQLNISYINSQEDGSGYQHFRMGLFLERPELIRSFLEEAAALCEIHVIDYDESEQVLDNTVFYMRFASRMAQKLSLPPRKARELMAQSNRIMQMLDARNEPPYKTFNYISRFADMLAHHKGAAFQPRLSRLPLRTGGELYAIEPPCGSNCYILHRHNRLLFVDSGFACYAPEMVAIFRRLFPGFDEMPRQMAITHPDMDHCGLLNLFDEIYVSPAAFRHFQWENDGAPNYRERNPAHAPYCAISRILSRYLPPELSHLRVVDGEAERPELPLCPLGRFEFAGLEFQLVRGNGGHADGEVLILCPEEALAFTGDIIVNISGFTREQADFNRLAPYLMTSVNMDSRRASVERNALLELYPPRQYLYCCGHGAIWDRRDSPANCVEILEEDGRAAGVRPAGS